MRRLLSTIVLTSCWLLAAIPLFAQLTEPVQPVNIIIDSDMSLDADDAGDHAMLWGLANRGEVKVLALIASSANDYSAPAMRAIANYYGHPEVPVGAHKGSTPTGEGAAFSDVAHARSENAIHTDDHFVARFDEIHKTKFHAGAASAADREGHFVFREEDMAQHRFDLLHHFDKGRIQMADQRT